MVLTTIPLKDFQITQGSELVGNFASTSFGTRTFCRACGSPLTIHVRHQPNEIDVAVGTLDNPDGVKPTFHLYVSEAPGWVVQEDGLSRYAALRPDTRGLRTGQVEA